MAKIIWENEAAFYRWLIPEVSPAKLPILRECFKEIEKRCKKYRIIKKDFFTDLTPQLANRIKQSIGSDKVFRLFHLSQMETIETALQLLLKYAEFRERELIEKSSAANVPEKNHQSEQGIPAQASTEAQTTSKKEPVSTVTAHEGCRERSDDEPVGIYPELAVSSAEGAVNQHNDDEVRETHNNHDGTSAASSEPSKPKRPELSDELQELLRGDEFEPLKRVLIRQGVLTLEEFKKYHLDQVLKANDLYTLEQRNDICRIVTARMREAARLARIKQLYGMPGRGEQGIPAQGPTEATIQDGEEPDSIMIAHGVSREVQNAEPIEAVSEPDVPPAEASSDRSDDAGICEVKKSAEENSLALSGLPEPKQPELSSELQELLCGDEFEPLKRALIRQGVLTLEEFKKYHLDRFLKANNVYTPDQRKDICRTVVARMREAARLARIQQLYGRPEPGAQEQSRAVPENAAAQPNASDREPADQSVLMGNPPEASSVQTENKTEPQEPAAALENVSKAESPALSTELAELLNDPELEPLRGKLEELGIKTVEQFEAIRLWSFLNDQGLYPYLQRNAVYEKVRALLGNRDSGHKETIQDGTLHSAGKEAAAEERSVGENAEAMTNRQRAGKDNAEISQDADVTSSQRVKAEDQEPVPEIPSLPLSAIEKEISAPCVPDNKISEESTGDVLLAEEQVLAADLNGLTYEELAKAFSGNIAHAKRIVAASRHILSVHGKLIHEDALVDWEETQEQLAGIVEKLLTRNHGYAAAAQLYEFVRADMQMFLNDNDIDTAECVYSLTKFLFEKHTPNGLRLVFQGNHISRANNVISTNLDLFRSFAREQGGIFKKDDLVDYLQRVKVKTGNLNTQMQINTSPIFLIYNEGVFITSESIGINEQWLAEVNTALKRLFDDQGDHIALRDINENWFSLLPTLPRRSPWTPLLLQSVLSFYSKRLGKAHTIPAMDGQSFDTLHAMLVSADSPIETFSDAVFAVLRDDGITQSSFQAEELRQLLVRRGLISGGELSGNMPKALSKDERFGWSADGQTVTIRE